MASLTEEQEAFLAECEAEFSDRYTESDKDYMMVKEAGICPPPIVTPWFARHRDGGRHRGNRGRGFRGRDYPKGGEGRSREDDRGFGDNYRNKFTEPNYRDRSRSERRERSRSPRNSEDCGNKYRERTDQGYKAWENRNSSHRQEFHENK